MNRRVVALPLLALVGCLHHAVPKDRSVESTLASPGVATPLTTPLRVVTFNVYSRPGHEVAKALRTDRELRHADVIIIVEAHRGAKDPCSSACVVAKELGFHAVFAPGHVQGDGPDGVAIVSRVPIRSAEVIELPQFDVHWNDGRRIAMAATIDVEGQPVTVYAVHLENRVTVAQRRRQMMPVIEHAKRRSTPVIIAGDFNTSPFTWINHAVPVPTGTQDDRFEELLREHGFDTPTAESGATSRYLGMKLDAIYTRGFDVGRFAVSDGSGISDHLALWANMTLRR